MTKTWFSIPSLTYEATDEILHIHTWAWVRERFKHKEFQAVEDHQYEAAVETSGNCPHYWALCCLNLSLAEAITCHHQNLILFFLISPLSSLPPYECKASLILISDVLFMMLQVCYLQLTVPTTYFSLKDTAWPCNSFHASSFRGWAFLFEWITSNHFSASIISSEQATQRAPALVWGWVFFPLWMLHFSQAETYYGNSDTDNCVNHTPAKVIDDLIPVKYEMIRLPHGILIIWEPWNWKSQAPFCLET